MTGEWQMYCVLSGLTGAAMTLSRKPSEFATAAWHAAGQAVITKRRIYDLLGPPARGGSRSRVQHRGRHGAGQRPSPLPALPRQRELGCSQKALPG